MEGLNGGRAGVFSAGLLCVLLCACVEAQRYTKEQQYWVYRGVFESARPSLCVTLPDGLPLQMFAGKPLGRAVNIINATCARRGIEFSVGPSCVVRDAHTMVMEIVDTEDAGLGEKHKPEGFRSRMLGGTNVWRISGRIADRGLAYGVYSAERRLAKLGECERGWDCVQHDKVTGPAFSRRFYSEQGMFLDIPDRSYWTDTPPYFNQNLLLSQWHGYDGQLNNVIYNAEQLYLNAIQLFNDNPEDYLTYRDLPKQTYANNSIHAQRAEGLSGFVDGIFAETQNSTQMDTYLLFFEFSFPPELAQNYNLTLGSPDLQLVLRAKYKELFERIPHCTGVVIYVSDSWLPRAGYNWKQLWNTPEEMGQVAALYYDAIVDQLGKDLIFSVWIPKTPLDEWKAFSKYIPKNITICVNLPEGDFLIDHPINHILNDSVGLEYKVIVNMDVWRQYSGYGQLIVSPGQQWTDRLLFAKSTNVTGVSLYGQWAEGCNWPDSGPELINQTKGTYKTWQGLWIPFNIYGPSFTSAQVNMYIGAELAWDPNQNFMYYVHDFGMGTPMALDDQGADNMAQAYNMSYYAWMTTYFPNVDEYYVKWSMVFNPKFAPSAESNGYGLVEFYTNVTYTQLLESNALAMNLSTQMVDLICNATDICWWGADELYAKEGIKDSNDINPTIAPRTDLVAAVNKTHMYLTVFTLWRAAWYANRSLEDLPTQDRPQRCRDLDSYLADLQPAINWWARFPEGVTWQIFAPDPALNVRPTFFDVKLRSMNDWIPEFRRSSLMFCPADGRGGG